MSGQAICASLGATNTIDCGTAGRHHTSTSPTCSCIVAGTDYSGIAPNIGDSGSPVYANETALGRATAQGLIATKESFTRVKDALLDFSATLVTDSPEERVMRMARAARVEWLLPLIVLAILLAGCGRVSGTPTTSIPGPAPRPHDVDVHSIWGDVHVTLWDATGQVEGIDEVPVKVLTNAEYAEVVRRRVIILPRRDQKPGLIIQWASGPCQTPQRIDLTGELTIRATVTLPPVPPNCNLVLAGFAIAISTHGQGPVDAVSATMVAATDAP